MSTLGHQYDNSLVSNAFGFLRLPMNFQPYDSDADWVITGVPFDMATSGRAGGRHGPAAIRQVSTNLAWEHNRFPWNFDMRERLNVVDCGDLVYAFGDAREMSEKLQAHAEKLLAAGKRMLSFGGDHFVTLPLLRAHAKHFGKMALVHFDAHTDTYANGCEFDHGTMFYTAPKEGLIDPNHSVQIGIRTEFDKDNGFTVLDACQVNDRSVDDVIAQVKQIVGDMPVYLTFDIDCLDPAFAYVNFSLFQSMPDAWGIDQLFPVLPLEGLDQVPERRAVLLDITCDSDGAIDHYIDGDGIATTMPMPEYDPENPPMLGFFMVGAYQEILGNMHNLFGDTEAVDVFVFPDGSVEVELSDEGDTVADMLQYVQLDPKTLLTQFRDQVKKTDLDAELQQQFLEEFEAGLYGYTYLEDE